MFAARIVGTGWASAVATAAMVVVLATAGAPGHAAADPLAVPACAAAQLSAGYTVIPFSQGAGTVAYVLTVRNRSAQTCALTAPLPMQLLDRRGRPLATHVAAPDSGYQVVLAPSQWAQAESRFSPDIAGPGENPSECEPPAHLLSIEIGDDHVLAPMDPSPVCENGTISFGRLTAVQPTPACNAASLSASFTRASPPYQGATAYYLTLDNTTGEACHTRSFARLALLDATGDRLPTRMQTGIGSPYVIPAGGEAYAVATLRTTAAPDEPAHGPCEPLATQVRIEPGRRSGALTTPIEPSVHACHDGGVALSGLYPADS
jgi:hypothetical protein